MSKNISTLEPTQLWKNFYALTQIPRPSKKEERAVQFAKDFGDEGCLYELGCKGPVTHCDISTRGWNSGVNWCNRAGGPCVGCTETFFPGATGSGLYEKLPAAQVPGLANINANANTIGIALGAATAAGIGAHAIARAVSSKKLKNKNKNENVEDKEGN